MRGSRSCGIGKIMDEAMKRQEEMMKNEKGKFVHANGKIDAWHECDKSCISSQNQTHEGQMENSLSPYTMDRIRKIKIYQKQLNKFIYYICTIS